MNRDAAITQANLNRIDQFTPQGSLTYSQNGTNADGTPRWAQTQTLSADEQAKYDMSNRVAIAMSKLANDNVSRVQDVQSKPFSYDGMTPVRTDIGNANPFGIRTGPQMGYGVQNSIGDQGQVREMTGNEGGQIYDIGNNQGQVRELTGNEGGDFSRLTGNEGGAIRTINGRAGGPIQRGLNYSGLTDLPGTNDFSADARRVADNVYGQATSRLDPAFAQRGDDMRSQLAAKGISENSDAYRRELDNFSRDRNDAYNQAAFSAQQAGGAEQSRIFGMAMGARQQGQNEVNTQGQFANAAQQQQYGQQLQNVAQQNQAQAQRFGQAAQTVDQQNQVQNLRFGQAATTVDQQNQAQAQRYGQDFQNVNQRNSAQQQRYGQAAQTIQQQNQAQDQRYSQALSIADLFNNANAQQFGQDQSAAAFNNNAQSQYFNQDSANATFQNNARQQQINEATYLRNLPLNEIAALLSGSQVNNPEFQQFGQVGVAAPDYSGLAMSTYNAKQNAYNQAQANRSQMMGSIFGTIGSIGSAVAMSDRRLKTDIKEIGKLPLGIPTYAFKYIGSKLQQFGVMAQDVFKVLPEAVGTINGYMYVDYAKVYNATAN